MKDEALQLCEDVFVVVGHVTYEGDDLLVIHVDRDKAMEIARGMENRFTYDYMDISLWEPLCGSQVGEAEEFWERPHEKFKAIVADGCYAGTKVRIDGKVIGEVSGSKRIPDDDSGRIEAEIIIDEKYEKEFKKRLGGKMRNGISMGIAEMVENRKESLCRDDQSR